jgi:thioredoxin 1
MSSAVAVTDASFTELVLESDLPVLVDFWADWCGPCRMMAPMLDQIAAEYGEKITVVKLNIDENPEIADKYKVMSIPFLSVFVNGEIVKEIVGAKAKAALLRELNPLL